MKSYLKKALNLLFWLLDKVDKKHYILWYPKYLCWLGVDIDAVDAQGTWISPTIFLDSSNYSMIHIGKNVTISFDVAILVHDYSIVHAARERGRVCHSIINKPVFIGNNCFVGARTMILPGSIIGDNCIIGAGSVVRGQLEPKSIYAGDPCVRIGSIENFAEKYKNLMK